MIYSLNESSNTASKIDFGVSTIGEASLVAINMIDEAFNDLKFAIVLGENNTLLKYGNDLNAIREAEENSNKKGNILEAIKNIFNKFGEIVRGLIEKAKNFFKNFFEKMKLKLKIRAEKSAIKKSEFFAKLFNLNKARPAIEKIVSEIGQDEYVSQCLSDNPALGYVLYTTKNDINQALGAFLTEDMYFPGGAEHIDSVGSDFIDHNVDQIFKSHMKEKPDKSWFPKIYDIKYVMGTICGDYKAAYTNLDGYEKSFTTICKKNMDSVTKKLKDKNIDKKEAIDLLNVQKRIYKYNLNVITAHLKLYRSYLNQCTFIYNSIIMKYSDRLAELIK